MKTIAYLIRHGETDWNMQGRWQGHTDVPLNDIGFKQAKLLAQRLFTEGIHFDSIYSSDLTRAYQTAWEIGTLMHTAVKLLPSLREIDLGTWSGMTREQIRQRYPHEMLSLEQGHDIPRGGGETMAALSERVVKVIEAIVCQHPGETLAFVTHGGPVRMMLNYVCQGFDINQFPFKHIGNASMSILHHTKTDGWVLVSCNDVQHLDQPQAPDLMSAPPDDAERPITWNP
jgi:broad specificity phosphatase PhoE